MTATAGGLLSQKERRTLNAVCDALMPTLEPQDGDSGVLFRLSAADVDLAGAVEQAMAALSARQTRELRLYIRLLDSPLFMLLVAGKPSALSSMKPREREDALLTLANSALPVVRTGFQALKRLATFLFYSVIGDGATNPTWPAIGYSVPIPGPANSALSITRISQPTTLDADVCIIGSGAGGGVVAAQLTAAGRSVLVLEAGPGDQAAEFDQREIIGMQRLYLEQGTTATRDLSVAILAGSCVGGGTSVNWQTSLRTPDFIRDEWADRSGIRAFADDTFTRALDAVCGRINVGTGESARNGNNAPLERGCAALGYRWSDIPRNSRGCDLTQCGFCVFGCRVGGKQSTANTYLRDAQQAGRGGRATIVASCKAEHLRLDHGRVAGVQAVARDERAGTRFPVRVNARTVVVAAGALETPAFLMRSGIEHPQLGRNLYLHPATGVAGRYVEPVRGWIGAPQTVLCDEFGQRRGNYGYRIETAPIHPGLLSLSQPWYGARDHRTRMQRLAHVSAFIVLTRDRQSGRVTVDAEGRAVVDYAIGRMERELLQEGIASGARVHWAAGATEIHTLHSRDHTLRRSDANRTSDIDAFCHEVAALPVHANRCAVFSAHQMGTCRMGIDPRRNVCDERGQVHGVPGLYVADTSLFPASSGVNPMITVMALAHMVGAGIGEGTAHR
jgi:choline dehydrogenase-like flavoprotein